MPLPLMALLPLITTLAPGIVRALAGDKAGDVAQQVTSAVRAVAGTDDPAEVEIALRDPQRAADLRLELARIEAEAQREELRAVLADVADARAHTVALVKARSPIAWGAPIVSALVLIAFGCAVYVVLTRSLPPGSQEIALYTVGSLQTLAAAVVAYWVGSSAGSARKDEALREQARR
jgi:hypothetical protein